MLKKLLKKLSVAIFTVALVSTVGAPVFAQDGHDDEERSGLLNRVESKVDSTVKNVAGDDSTSTVKEVRDQLKTQRQQIDDKKQELKQKIDERQSERKEKLEGRRLAQCQNREDNINALMGKSASAGKMRLTRIQKFEEGIRSFYVAQGLQSESYDTLAAAADEAEAAAIAAVDVYASEKYDCAVIDASDTTGPIRESHASAKGALKAYRDSVVQLLKAVKAAFAEKQATSGEETASDE